MLEWGFDYAGPAADAEKLLGPFNAIKAIQVGSSEASYPIVSGADDTECPGAKRAISSVMTLEYNVTTERTLYNLFNKKIAEYPELAPPPISGTKATRLPACRPYLPTPPHTLTAKKTI